MADVYIGDKKIGSESIYVKKEKNKETLWNKIKSWFDD